MIITATRDGHVVVPADIARLAGILPGMEVDVELTDCGLLVRPNTVAEAADAQDVAAAEAALAEHEARGGEAVTLDELKLRHGL